MTVAVELTKPSIRGESRFFYGYVLVAVCFSLQVIGWGAYNSFGVFFNPIMTAFDWQRADISVSVSISYIIYGLSGILLGRLNDKVGPRLIMTICGTILGLGYLLMSRVEALWQLYLFYGVLVGVGIGGTDVVLLSTIARWFIRMRGRMSGILKVGTGVGMILFPLITHWLIDLYNWRMAFVSLGVVHLVLFLALAQLLVRDPARRGLFPDNDGNKDSAEFTDTQEGISFRQALGSSQVWMICGAYFIVYTCAITILLHIVPHAIDLGVASADATRVLATLGAVSIAGRLVMGFATDAIGSKRTLAVCFLLMAGALLLLLVADTLWLLLVFAVLYGFVHGGFFALISPLVAEYVGMFSHGAILGLVIFIATIGGAIGPMLAGYIFDLTGSYHIVFLSMPVLCVVGLITALLLYAPARRTF